MIGGSKGDSRSSRQYCTISIDKRDASLNVIINTKRYNYSSDFYVSDEKGLEKGEGRGRKRVLFYAGRVKENSK